MARFKFVALAPIIALLLVVGLLWLVRAGAAPDPALPVAEPSQAVTLPTVAAQTARTSQKTTLPGAAIAALTPTADPSAVAPPELATGAETPAAVAAAAITEPAPDAVAIVDGVALSPADFDQLRVIDAVMAGLAGQANSSPAAILEQWVNGELVWQRAVAAGLPAIDPDAALDGFLARIGRGRTELDAALTDAQFSSTTFAAYWRKLVAVQQFVQEQAAAQDLDATTYVRRLQEEAHISFGPTAGAIFDAPVPAQPAAVTQVATQPEPVVAEATLEEVAAEITASAETVTAVESPAEDAIPEPRGVDVGMLAPEFVLATVADGAPALGLDDLRGQPTVLSFWTTWCPYCLRQTPVLVDAYGEWAAQGIQFVGVNVQEDRNTVQPYLTQQNIEYPILLDEQGAVAAAFAVQGYPTTYFLDQENRIMARHVGALTAEQLNPYLSMIAPSTPEQSEASP